MQSPSQKISERSPEVTTTNKMTVNLPLGSFQKDSPTFYPLAGGSNLPIQVCSRNDNAVNYFSVIDQAQRWPVKNDEKTLLTEFVENWKKFRKRMGYQETIYHELCLNYFGVKTTRGFATFKSFSYPHNTGSV